MKVAFIKNCNIDDLTKNRYGETDDLIAVAFGVAGDVSGQTEINGKTDVITRLAKYSEQCKNVIIAGINFDLFGIERKSAVVIDSGRLCGISDSVYASEKDELSSSNVINVYETSRGKIGVVVDKDIYHFEIAHALRLYGADFLVGIVDENMSESLYSHVSCTSEDRGIAVICAARDCSLMGHCRCGLDFDLKTPFCENDVNTKLSEGLTCKSSLFKTIYKKLSGKNLK